MRDHFTHADHQVDIRGIDNHAINSIPIATAGGVTKTTMCEVIMHQWAYYYKCHIIHSSRKIEHFKNYVDNKPIIVGGKQNVITNDNHMMTITVKISSHTCLCVLALTANGRHFHTQC